MRLAGDPAARSGPGPPMPEQPGVRLKDFFLAFQLYAVRNQRNHRTIR